MNNFKTYWSTKPNNLCSPKNLKKSLHILEDGTSDDIEQVIVKILFKIC